MGERDAFKHEAWSLHPILDVPSLFPPAVLFSVLDSDPRPKYSQQLNRMREKSRDQNSDSGSPLDARLMRQSQASVAWDAVFHEVPGDRMTLLFQNPERPGNQSGASKESGSAGPVYAVMIKSNAPGGAKWLATRSMRFKDQLVCWCVPVELETGKTTSVTLTVQNMTVLESE
jgi:hypothetical protein